MTLAIRRYRYLADLDVADQEYTLEFPSEAGSELWD